MTATTEKATPPESREAREERERRPREWNPFGRLRAAMLPGD